MDRKEFNRLFTMGLGAGIANLNGANNLLEIFRENSLSGLKGIPKTDTHMHIMDFDNFEYPWLNQYPEINKSFLIKDYEKASRKSNISKSIFIESGAKAGSSIEETKRILTLAKQSQKLKGLVPRGTIANQEKFNTHIDTLLTLGSEMIKGIRGQINQNIIQSPEFITCMNYLEKNNLNFDLLIRPGLFLNMAKVIDKTPHTIFIINHLGFPNIEKGEIDFWQKGIGELAKRPNVYCKISGVLTQAGENWNLDMIRPFTDFVIKSFGFKRLMYGSDWPGILRIDSFHTWSRAFENLTKQYSEDEINHLYHLNADRVYRLDD